MQCPAPLQPLLCAAKSDRNSLTLCAGATVWAMLSLAGPFLLFKGGAGGSEANRWRGSVLVLTRDGSSAAQGWGGGGAAAAAAGPEQAAAPQAAAAAAAAPAAAPPAAAAAAAAAAEPKSDQTIENGPAAHTAPTAAASAAPRAAAQPPPPTLHLTDETASGQNTLQAVQLDAAEGWTFWRFDLQLELTAWQVGAGVPGVRRRHAQCLAPLPAQQGGAWAMLAGQAACIDTSL